MTMLLVYVLFHLAVSVGSAGLQFSRKDWGDPLPTYGVSNYTCPGNTMRPSKNPPASAHSVRPADIKIVAALGDSLTVNLFLLIHRVQAGNGAGAEDPLAIILQYRGLTFNGGGERTLEQQATIPNILKKFNPNLFGYATGTSSPNVWEIAHLNQAMPGAGSESLAGQARDIISLMQTHPDKVDFENDWKVVNIFSGGNDVCGFCRHPVANAPPQFGANLRAAIQVFYERVPKVIVILTSMIHLEMLRESDQGQFFCQALHTHECGCEGDLSFTNEQIANICIGYQQEAMNLQVSGIFDGRDDFTLVVQTPFNNVTIPPHQDFFAPDCFHFSQLGHALVSTWLWNGILQPVGSKSVMANMSAPAIPLACPDANCPFIRTTKNSANCTAYLTDPADG